MLGGSNCIMSGGKKVKKVKNGGDDCKMKGGAKKKKNSKKVVKRRRGGGLCVGNLHPFEASESSSGPSAPAPTPMPSALQMDGGAKKRKSRKAGPYAKFVKKHFASVQKKHPSWKATDCMKEIAKMWRAQKK